MPLSNVQHGVIAQNEFAKYLMMGSGGRIELAAPLTDEERRDFEIHVHGEYGSGLAVQVKSTLALTRLGARPLPSNVFRGAGRPRHQPSSLLVLLCLP